MGTLQLQGSRRTLLKGAGATVLSSFALAQSRPPNIVLILADDLGYGDLGCYGSGIGTPNLNRMAREGIRFTHYCSASSVCSPARAGLLTGRYPGRVGVPRVLDPNNTEGLPDSETTIARMLKSAGYTNMCIGKWHLGSTPDYLPTRRGFDEYYGIPYSHDMWPRTLMRNTEVVERTADLSTLTLRYTEAAVDFIGRSRNAPFFLYLPHNLPHIPLPATPGFFGMSGHGRYGDAVREIDWSVGQVLQALKDHGLDDNTLVMFSSDNGPWFLGTPGKLRGRKGETYEGGFRVPMIARFPGRIPAGQVSDGLVTGLDILPTVARLAGATLPSQPLDGIDVWPMMAGWEAEIQREAFLYFNDVYLQCARLGPWKLHISRFNVPMFTPEPPRGRVNLPLPRPELYNVVEDPEEGYDRAERNPAIVGEIQSRIDRLIRTFPDYIADAYETTRKRGVEDTPANSLPVEKIE